MKKIISICFVIMFFIKTYAQNVTVEPDGISPGLNGTYKHMSYDAILAIHSPSVGYLVYDTTFKCLRVYTEGKWLCTFQNPFNYSPNIIEVVSAGGLGNDSGCSIATDAAGNAYVAGAYTGTVNFELTTKTSLGSDDIFIAKYNKNGILQWVQSAGGTDKDSVQSIAVDGSGNVYITGNYKSSATFGTTSLTSSGQTDIFLAKYNTNGVFQWAQSAGGTGSDVGAGITIDGSNNIYIAGFYTGTAAFGAFSKTAAGMRDIFFAKYNINGTVQWVESAGGTNDDFGTAIATDGSGQVYITGSFREGAHFGTINDAANETDYDVFVAKYDPAGNTWIWESSALVGSNQEYSQSIAVDGNGNIYVTGYFSSAVSFGSTAKASNGLTDMFIVKFNNLSAPQWLQTAGGTGFDLGQDITVDNSGNVHVTGYYSGTTCTFGSTVKDCKGLYDAFVARYNSDGKLFSVKTIGGAGNEMGKSITADIIGNIYVTGNYSNSIRLDKKFKVSQGEDDIFIIRLDK